MWLHCHCPDSAVVLFTTPDNTPTSFATDTMQESDALRPKSDYHERTSDLYTDNLRGRPVTPWEQRPNMASQLNTPLQHLSPDTVTYAQDYAPTAPLQVRIARARPDDDETLTVAQMSKNLVSLQQGLNARKDTQARSDKPDRHRSKSLTRTKADGEQPLDIETIPDVQAMQKTQALMMKTIGITQQTMSELQHTIKMHAEVLADHRDAIRKTTERSEHHELVMLKHSNSLSKLKSKHDDSSAAHTSLAVEVARIKQNFSAKTVAPVKVPNDTSRHTDTYTSFKQLQSKYKAV